MDVRQLEYFVQVATLRGFNRASAHLRVAQSALSRQIRDLEAELGVALFVRDRRGVQLTPAGRLMLERAEFLLRQFRQTRDELVAQASLPRGELSLGMPPSLRTMVVVPLLREFRAQYPAVFVNTWIATSMVLRDLVLTGKADLAVFGVIEPEPVLETQPLIRDDMFVVAPPSQGFDAQATIDLPALAELPLILTSRPNSLRLLVEDAVERRRLRLNVVMEANSVPLIVDLIREGGGYSVLPYSAVHALIEAGAVSAAKVRNLSYAWVIANSRERPLSAAGLRMRDMVRSIAVERIRGGLWPNARLSQ